MHHTQIPGLYSPSNFLLGCRLTLTSRVAVTSAQALQELAPTPRRAFGAVAMVLFAVLAGLALLLAAVRGLGQSAPAAMQQLASVASTHGVAVTVAVVVFAAFSLAVWRAGRCSANFYGAMCRIGHAHRCEVAGRSPTLRCYTRQD